MSKLFTSCKLQPFLWELYVVIFIILDIQVIGLFRDALTEFVALNRFQTRCKMWRIRSFRLSNDFVY